MIDSQPGRPLTAAFYYPWYPQGWGNRANGYTHFHPSLGWYDGAKVSVVANQIDAMRYAHVQAGIASWWGVGSKTDGRVPLLLSSTAKLASPLRWALYYENESLGDPSVSQISSDLSYIAGHYGSGRSYYRVNGRPVVFVYTDGNDARELVRQKDMLFSLEAGVDKCEDAMDAIRSVIVKNG